MEQFFKELLTLQNILTAIAFILSIVFGLVSLRYKILIKKARGVVLKYLESKSPASEGGRKVTKNELEGIAIAFGGFLQELAVLLFKKK